MGSDAIKYIDSIKEQVIIEILINCQQKRKVHFLQPKVPDTPESTLVVILLEIKKYRTVKRVNPVLCDYLVSRIEFLSMDVFHTI